MHDRLDISMRANHVFFALLLVVAVIGMVLAAVTNDVFYLRLATEALILGGLALSVDILLGFGGLFFWLKMQKDFNEKAKSEGTLK